MEDAVFNRKQLLVIAIAFVLAVLTCLFPPFVWEQNKMAAWERDEPTAIDFDYRMEFHYIFDPPKTDWPSSIWVPGIAIIWVLIIAVACFVIWILEPRHSAGH